MGGLAIYQTLATDLKDLIKADDEEEEGVQTGLTLDPSLQAKLNNLKMSAVGLGGGSGGENSSLDMSSIKVENKTIDTDGEGLAGFSKFSVLRFTGVQLVAKTS